MFWFHFVAILRPDDAAGGSGHGSREEVAGDSHKCGEPERREEGRGLPLIVPRSGEQEREEGDPGLWTGQSKRHHGAGRITSINLHVIAMFLAEGLQWLESVFCGLQVLLVFFYLFYSKCMWLLDSVSGLVREQVKSAGTLSSFFTITFYSQRSEDFKKWRE